MDLGCLAMVGVALLVLGGGTLLFERVRQRRDNSPYPYPDLATALIPEGDDPDSTPIQPKSAFPSQKAVGTSPKSAGQGRGSTAQSLKAILKRLGARTTAVITRTKAGRAPQAQQPSPAGGPIRRGVLAFAALSVAIFSLALVAALVTTAGPQVVAKKGVVVAVAGFLGEPSGVDTQQGLADYILQSALAGGHVDVGVKLSRGEPASWEQAEAERALLKADFLLWGEVGASGAITASIAFAPEYKVGQEAWQRYTDGDTSALVFPQQARIYLAPGVGTDPLVPLTLALVYLRSGDYAAAAGAASGAQSTLDDGNGSGQIARFVQATANTAGGHSDLAVAQFAKIEEAGILWPEMMVNRGIAYLKLSDWVGAHAYAERAIASRDASDRALARANLVRARARWRPGAELTQAVSDLDEALRLDPDYAHARLDKAEVLYRQSQPDAARQELETLLARTPDNAPAYRLHGLVRLMLAQPDDAQGALGNAARLYSEWISSLRQEEGKAQVAGEAARAEIATEGILALNRELAGVFLYQGVALGDKARKEPPESFLGGVWRNIRGEQTLYERATGKMQEAQRLDPRRADIPVQLGSLYVQMGDTGKGAQALANAREIDPTAPEPYLALAHLQEAQRNLPEAIKTITELTANSQGYYPAYEELYRLYTQGGDAQSAATSLQRALQFAPQSPSDHLWRGKFLQLLGNTSEAEGEFRTALLNPDLWEAHVHLGEILQQAGRRPEALAEFRQALAVQPNDPRALLGAARLLVLAGEVADAEKLFERLTELAPHDVDGHIAFSQLLFSKGDIEGAIEHGKQAIAAGPGRADAHFYLGLAYEPLKDWSAAAEEFRAAAARNPQHFEALVRLSRTLYFQDKYEDLIQTAQAASKLRPDDPQPYRWAAAAQFALGDHQGALASLGKALQLNPQYVEALALASKVYAMHGDFANALNMATRATQADPRNPSGVLAAGDVYVRQGNSQLAIQAFDFALATGLQEPDALTGKGRAYHLAGDYAGAVKFFNDALARDPNFVEANLYAGDTYAQLGNWDEALRQYSHAAQVRPTWAEALYGQGKAFLRRGNTDQALAAFERAVQSLPDYAEAWAGRGIAYRNKGQHNEAIAALQRATQINPAYADAWLSLGLTYEELGDRAQALQAFTHAANTATAPAIRKQAESGLDRVK